VSVDALCRSARVLEVWAARGGRGATALVDAPADCPLTFAMSYAETLQARLVGIDGLRRDRSIFPAYGALAAVWVPRGTTEVRIEAVAPGAPWPAAWIALGLALLVVGGRLLRRAPPPV
jgi:hypothetical protein